MKKIFTLFLVMFTLVGFAQMRPSEAGIAGTFKADGSQFAKEGTMLLPGNWANATDFVLYTSSGGGYVNGTNNYGDLAKAMKFTVDEPYTILGVYLWFGAVEGTTGTVDVKIWEFDNLPTDVIVSKAVSVGDLTYGDDFATDLFYVEFDTPVEVTADYAIGIAFDNIGTTQVGLYSSQDPQGGGLDLAYEMWDNGTWYSYMNASSWELDLDMGIFPNKQSASEGFDVTFKVDMTAVEGFDPGTHHVWVTGNFTGWAQPGTEGSVEMTLVTTKEDTPPFTLTESFENFDDWTTDLTPWTTIQLSSGPTYSSNNFDFTGEGEEWAWKVFNPSQTAPSIVDTHPAQDGAKYAVAIQYTSTNDDKWLISPEVSINETSELSFWAKSITDAYGMERIQVMVSTTDNETTSFTKISDGDYIEVPTSWTEYTFDLSAYAGETIYFAIHYVSFDAFIFMLDNIKLTAETANEDLFYTATVNIPAGELQYKYFSDVVGSGWDGGEWAGDPNRVVEITEATTLNDIFGQQPNVSVDEVILEDGIRVYPNPVRDILTIRSESQIDYLRVFDLSGRIVFNSDVKDLGTTIDVSGYNNGIYILQMISGQQVTTRKIQVVK